MARCWNPPLVSHTRAATACTDTDHVHAKSELWVKIGRVRKSTFHFQRVYFLVRYVGHLLFRPFSASLILFVFGLSLPATAVLRFSTEGIPLPCLNGRAAVRALFNGRRILRNYATTLARLRSMPLIGFSR